MYRIIVDGHTVGVMELSKEDIKALASDPDIRVIKLS